MRRGVVIFAVMVRVERVGGISRGRVDCLEKRVVVEMFLNMEGHFDKGGRHDTHDITVANFTWG